MVPRQNESGEQNRSFWPEKQFTNAWREGRTARRRKAVSSARWRARSVRWESAVPGRVPAIPRNGRRMHHTPRLLARQGRSPLPARIRRDMLVNTFY